MKTVLTSPVIGQTVPKISKKEVVGSFVSLLGESFYKIQHFDAMAPFFISLVSGFDHWMFISSTGGLTAGRVSAEQALFPYYTDDKVTENFENTGNKAILLVTRGKTTHLWEPFSMRYTGVYDIERNLYKNIVGSTLVFEEVNHELDVTYRYAWRTSDQFGFVKTSWVINHGKEAHIELVDGLQNILPAKVTSQTQNVFSNLLDAYKRAECEPTTGLGLFSLSSTLTDLAEPSESLLTNTVAQVGLEDVGVLLSSAQLDNFRAGREICSETDIRGARGAYFIHARLDLAPGQETTWHLLAEVSQDTAAIVCLLDKLKNPANLIQEIETDMAANQQKLNHLVACADGQQYSSNELSTGHHFANVMFNIMRGGIFADQYWMDTADFMAFLRVQNQPLYLALAEPASKLPARVHLSELRAFAEKQAQPDLLRLTAAYLPLTFSRRHGDPSRPWNRFAIQIKNPDGSQRLDHEGNWRDIFQNWEALALSYPEYVENMISVFLNATTVDGYNPYRITRAGIDWEKPEPDNPWANIGYWSDHQIIYLQKLMELSRKFHPGKLADFLNLAVFSYASVPYRIKPYAALQKDANNSIEFDWDLEEKVEQRVKSIGADGKLVVVNDQVYHVSLTEKLLTLLLAKLTNFVPEGGIWMNTQRPEWNDANNALVGKGLSVVTLGYLRRYVVFFKELLAESKADAFGVSKEVGAFAQQMTGILANFRPLLVGAFTDEQRRHMMEAVGQAGGDYRWGFYEHGLSGENAFLSRTDIETLLETALAFIEHSLRANRRADNLYHAYNVLHLGPDTAAVSHLDEMLEGQVAILSSGLLSGEETLALLQSLRKSALYRADQHSYILYPDRDLPGFLHKNSIPPAKVKGLKLVAALVQANDKTLLTKDLTGTYHFNGNFRNIKDVNQALIALEAQYADLVQTDAETIRALFEDTFHHAQFTGRSGTFFAYEGLGSIYWHMVSKLLLAVQENAVKFREGKIGKGLREAYRDVRKGLSFHKTPEAYGAFPVDPYSHTPKGKGAKQPGMTGLVKEEILTRQVELGLFVHAGKLHFDPFLLDTEERLKSSEIFFYQDVNGKAQQIYLETGSLAFTFCQVPVILQTGEQSITVHFADGKQQTWPGKTLDEAISQHLFHRDGVIERLIVTTP